MSVDPLLKIRLAPIDWQILAILQVEGKATYADLARRVGLSQAAVHERVKKLERCGAIRGYRAMIDPAIASLTVTAFVFVEQVGGPRLRELPERFAAHPGVVSCRSIAGDESYLLEVRATDTAGLERLINELREIEGVERTRTVVGLTTWFEDRPVMPPDTT